MNCSLMKTMPFNQLYLLRVGMTSDLLYCLESSHSEDRSNALFDATVLDNAAIAQMLSCGRSKTFQEYANTLFVPQISLQKNCPIDLVWDVYLPDSLKGAKREKRGTGTRKKVSPFAVMPKTWKEFLCVDENKTKLSSCRKLRLVDHKAMIKNCIQPMEVMCSALLQY